MRTSGPVAEMVLAAGQGGRLDASAMVALAEAVEALEDAGIRCLVVRGGGRSFCEGFDRDAEVAADGVAALAAASFPTLAMLHGRVAGGGLALALACDVRFAAVGARLALDDGTGPVGHGALARLARIVGPARAMDMALTDRTLTAREAQAWGMIAAVHSAQVLRREAMGWARAVAARGPLGMRYAKEAVARALDLPLDDGIRLEQDLYVLLQTTADRREGVAAFLEDRRPRFHGR